MSHSQHNYDPYSSPQDIKAVQLVNVSHECFQQLVQGSLLSDELNNPTDLNLVVGDLTPAPNIAVDIVGWTADKNGTIGAVKILMTQQQPRNSGAISTIIVTNTTTGFVSTINFNQGTLGVFFGDPPTPVTLNLVDDVSISEGDEIILTISQNNPNPWAIHSVDSGDATWLTDAQDFPGVGFEGEFGEDVGQLAKQVCLSDGTVTYLDNDANTVDLDALGWFRVECEKPHSLVNVSHECFQQLVQGPLLSDELNNPTDLNLVVGDLTPAANTAVDIVGWAADKNGTIGGVKILMTQQQPSNAGAISTIIVTNTTTGFVSTINFNQGTLGVFFGDPPTPVTLNLVDDVSISEGDEIILTISQNNPNPWAIHSVDSGDASWLTDAQDFPGVGFEGEFGEDVGQLAKQVCLSDGTVTYLDNDAKNVDPDALGWFKVDCEKPQSLVKELDTEGNLVGITISDGNTIPVTTTLTVETEYETYNYWAEESGNLASNATQWSWGNGDVGIIGLPVGDNVELIAMGFHADNTNNAGDDMQIDLLDIQSGTPVFIARLSVVDVGDGQNDNMHFYEDLREQPVTIPDGAVLMFRSGAESGGVNSARAGIWTRQPTGREFVTDVKIS